MRKTKKATLFLLMALVLCAVSQPASAQTADERPAGFDSNRLGKITAFGGAQIGFVGMQIGDMTFIGRMCPGHSNADLDKLIKETLDEMGLTEEQFNKLAQEDAEGFEEQRDKIREALVKYWSTQDQSQTAQEKLQGVLDDIGKQNVGKLDEFYRRLEEKLKKLPAGATVIEFKDAPSGKMPFTFFGQPCTEQWTLNLILKPNLDKGGKLEGDYTIGIKYDLSGFAKNAKSVVETNGWHTNNFHYKTWDQIWALNLTQTSSGVCNVTRMLTGHAVAELSHNLADPSHKVIATPAGDQKNVNITGITLNADGDDRRGDKTNLNMDFTISADTDTFQFSIIRWVGTGPGGTSTSPQMPLPAKIPFDKGIWTRGANVGAEWKLRILP